MIVHQARILLAPFVLKVVNHSSRTESSKTHSKAGFYRILAKKKPKTVLLRHSQTQCDSNNWSIWPQNVPKEEYFNGVQTLLMCFSKMFCASWTAGHQRVGHYIRMKQGGCIILLPSLDDTKIKAVKLIFECFIVVVWNYSSSTNICLFSAAFLTGRCMEKSGANLEQEKVNKFDPHHR